MWRVGEKSFPYSIAVSARGHMVIFFENPMKITGIVIPGQSDDVFDGQSGGGKQESGLVQTLDLQKLLKGMAGIFFYDFADRISGHMQLA